MAKSKFDHNSQGEQGQTYAARVFDMAEVPDGKRMPDLMSRHDRFNPRLLLEVKTSGRGQRAKLRRRIQLHQSTPIVDEPPLIFDSPFK
ncbi:hypothetical protein J4413_00545 [Candidatus Woesearchaeota archaeon]|nr:hypothetical protein [Candidatus Woesearchaeota archaeon]